MALDDGFYIGRRSSTTGSGDTFTNPNPTPNSVGGIPAGSTFAAVPLSEMWRRLLYPTLYPTLTNPSNSISLSPSGLREVGEIIPSISIVSSFNRGSITPAYSTSGFRAGLPYAYEYEGWGVPSGLIPSTSLTNSQEVLNYTVVLNQQIWRSRVYYTEGEQPKDSTGANYSTPLAAGSTAWASSSIIGVYPWFATTSSIAVTTKQPLALMSSEYVQSNMVAESDSEKQIAEFPEVWSTITGIQFFNTISNSWEWLGGTKFNSLNTFSISTKSKIIQGTSVTYRVYTHIGSKIGARQLRWYTT